MYQETHNISQFFCYFRNLIKLRISFCMTYSELVGEILSVNNASTPVNTIGYSLLGAAIYASHVGSYIGNQIIIQGGIHGREYITTLLLVSQIKYLVGKLNYGGVYFIFNSNPDGERLSLDGGGWIPCQKTANFLIDVNGSPNFSLYKANANAVDLNTNFDALWGGGTQNVRCPSSENFIGFYPDSEREVNTLIALTRQVNPSLTISYHSKGEVIYYGFEGQTASEIARDEGIAYQLAAVTGYEPIFTEGSTGGYKDWCISKLNIPAFTLEVGSENLSHPLQASALPLIFEQNKDVPLIALNSINQQH